MNRREFLRNTLTGAVAIALAPVLVKIAPAVEYVTASDGAQLPYEIGRFEDMRFIVPPNRRAYYNVANLPTEPYEGRDRGRFTTPRQAHWSTRVEAFNRPVDFDNVLRSLPQFQPVEALYG